MKRIQLIYFLKSKHSKREKILLTLQQFRILLLIQFSEDKLFNHLNDLGFTTSEIPINDRLGNVDGGFPPQTDLIVQDGQNDSMLFTFNRNDEEGRPITGVYQTVDVGGKVYSPSSALGGDPNRVGFLIEPGITQYNYRNNAADIMLVVQISP